MAIVKPVQYQAWVHLAVVVVGRVLVENTLYGFGQERFKFFPSGG